LLAEGSKKKDNGGNDSSKLMYKKLLAIIPKIEIKNKMPIKSLIECT
jgi:hypothetical protein